MISNGRIQLFSLVLEKLHFQSVLPVKVSAETVILCFHLLLCSMYIFLSPLCNFLKLCQHDKAMFANLRKCGETKEDNHRDKPL